MTAPPLLAIPNISEGRNIELVARIAGTDALIDIHSDVDHNRSVLTYASDADGLVGALAAMIDRATTALDIRNHDGVHPRFGVVDVLPVVPYASTDEEAMRVVTELSWRVAQGPGITLFPYDRAADDRRTLPGLRRQLRAHPDPQHPSAGVICVGIRDPLIAFNVDLDAPIGEAQQIAADIRGDAIRAMAFRLPSRGLVQVSMNLVDPSRVGPKAAFDSVAARTNAIVEAELVGLAPESVLPQFEGMPLAKPARSIEQAFHRVR